MFSLDIALFKFINLHLSNPIFDVFFPWWTDVQKSWPFLFVFLPLLLIYQIYKKNIYFFKVLVVLGITLFIGSQINHHFLKPFFDRTRPVAEILLISPQGSPSFPSGHTVSAFIIAFVFSYYFPKQRVLFITLASLTGFSRIYCGVHYPSDVLGGVLFAFITSLLVIKGIHMVKIKSHSLFCFLLLVCTPAFAWEFKDPTQGKPFFPWLWEDEFKPTLLTAVDKTSLIIVASGAASVTAIHQYDSKIYHDNKRHQPFFDKNTAETFGDIGNGGLGIGIALTQILFDQENGINHTKAIFLTSLSHMSMTAAFQRDRPNKGNDFLPWSSSFPSGHTSSAFATAGSLAYSYGWKAGIPAYGLASMIAYSRVRMEKHWASDIVAGAFLGTFWARASFDSDNKSDEFTFVPIPIFDGMMISAVKEF